MYFWIVGRTVLLNREGGRTQTDIQTGRQTDRHTDRQADMQTCRQTGTQTGRQAHRQAGSWTPGPASVLPRSPSALLASLSPGPYLQEAIPPFTAPSTALAWQRGLVCGPPHRRGPFHPPPSATMGLTGPECLLQSAHSERESLFCCARVNKNAKLKASPPSRPPPSPHSPNDQLDLLFPLLL